MLSLELGHVLRLGTRCFNVSLELGSSWIEPRGRTLGLAGSGVRFSSCIPYGFPSPSRHVWDTHGVAQGSEEERHDQYKLLFCLFSWTGLRRAQPAKAELGSQGQLRRS